MKVDIDTSHPARWKVNVVVPKEEVDKEFDKQYKKISKSIQIKGFRPGKVPRSMLERRYGEQIKEIVIESLVEQTLKDVIQEKKLEPLVPPEIESANIEDGELKYTVIVEVLPQFELKDYSGIEVALPKVEVTNIDVEEELQKLRRENSKLVEVDRTAAWNDFIEVKLEAKDAGGNLLFKEDRMIFPLREETRPKEVVKSLIGSKKGDRRVVKDVFSENHPEPMLRGKEATFDIEVLAIKEATLPELDDEFAKDIGFENLERLKEAVRKQILQAKENERKSKAYSQIADALIAKHIFELPPALVEQELNSLSQQAINRLARSIGEDAARDFVEGRREELRKQAQERVRLNMLLDRIAMAENVSVSDEEVDAEIEKIASQINQPKEKVKGMLQKSGRIEAMRTDMRRNKVMEILLSKATIIEEKGGETL